MGKKIIETLIIIYTTVPDRGLAEKLANELLEKRLAACVNVFPQVTSFYNWENKIESSEELILIIKTRKSLSASCEKLIQNLHPYKIPAIVEIPITGGLNEYLDWIKTETH